MLTRTTENYLKALYYLHQQSPEISITDLGNEMGVSKPTANNMVKRLQEQGWVNYQKYKPLTLNDKGVIEAAIIIRKHRLAEMFLSKVMNFGWEEVHDIAEELEHIKSESFFERMDQILGFPTHDPHGSPIPDKEGNITPHNYQLLTQIKPGAKVEIKALRDSSLTLIGYLNKKDIALGITMEVHDIEKFDNSMILSYGKHSKVVLTETVCNSLYVEVLK